MNKRKIGILLTVIFSLYFFVACLSRAPRSPFSYDDLIEDVVSVQLIYYNNPNVRRMTTRRSGCFGSRARIDEMPNFNFDLMEVVEELPHEMLYSFLLVLVETSYEVFAHPDSPSGISIKILFLNGDFSIISNYGIGDSWSNFSGRFNRYGEIVDFYGHIEGAGEGSWTMPRRYRIREFLISPFFDFEIN